MPYRDFRNPYGARGGYVRDSRRDYDFAGDRRDRDFARGDRRYSEFDYDYADGEYDYDYDYADRDMARGRGRGRDRDRDMRRDYHKSKMLSEEELEHWTKKLAEQLEQKEKPLFKMEDVIKKAEAMGIRFDKFSPYEFYVTVLMMLTDYKKSIASLSPEMYIKLAKDWLCDEDSSIRYGEKLAAYYNHIVNEF